MEITKELVCENRPAFFVLGKCMAFGFNSKGIMCVFGVREESRHKKNKILCTFLAKNYAQ